MSERASDNTRFRFYEILNVSNTVSEYDLKNAYFYAYMTLRGINPKKSREVALAYEVLSDPEKRKVYDQNGEDALMICGRDPMDLFKSTFEGLPFGPRVQGRPSTAAAHGAKVRVVQEKKDLEVVVEKGSQNGQKITFRGEADEAPDRITGDIVFVVEQEAHAKFKRKGNDLFVEHSLSLIEALWGFQFVLTHLDNRQLLIKSNPGEVVKPGLFRAINDEGMPMYGQPFMRGKLYIHFTVDFPHSLDPLTPDLYEAMETIMPPRTSVQLDDMELAKCEVKTLHNVHIGEPSRKRARREQEAGAEDEDGHGGA